METHFPFFYPSIVQNWDSIEISPVRIEKENNSVEACEEGKEDFWSVYVRIPEEETKIFHCSLHS